MKRIKCLLLSGLIAIAAFSMVGCGKGEAKADTTKTESKKADVESSDKKTDSAVEDFAADNPDGDPSVDIDLTTLSSTFVYSEVFNMIMEPLEFVGKTIKMEGTCNVYKDPDTGKVYYACFISDASQCCSQGLEFVLDEDKYQQSDYPENGEEIIIKGTFATYDENGNQYLTMLDTELLSE